MGKIDIITKEYMENPVVFADAFNQFLYHGEQKIDPALLTELDTTGIVVPYGASGASVPEQKYREVLKLLYAMTDDRTAYCVMEIESQAEIHYALPVRNGVYDFLQLSRQVSKAASSHRQAMKKEKAGQPLSCISGQANGTHRSPCGRCIPMWTMRFLPTHRTTM